MNVLNRKRSSFGEFGFRGEVIVLSSGQLVNLHNIRQDAANWFLLFGFLLFFFSTKGLVCRVFGKQSHKKHCVCVCVCVNVCVCMCVCVCLCVCVGSYEALPNFTMQKSGNG